MTPDEKRRAIAEAHGATPEEAKELAKWMAEMIDDEDLVLPRTPSPPKPAKETES